MRGFVLILFAAFSFGELVSRLIGNSLLHWFCKPGIMLTLGAYYLLHDRTTRSRAVLLAIFFSLAGDVALIIESEDFFITGLTAFLLGNLCYILAYRQHRFEAADNDLQGVQKIRLAFPIVLAGTGLVVVLYPTLGELRIPVVIYSAVLVAMVLSALFRFGRTTNNSFWMVFCGALTFMISDSLLAIDKFLLPVSHASLLIMSTYIIAQFLLIQGLILHHPNLRMKRTIVA
jgi:uncharacterized membrane protein YhhN